MAPVPIIDLTLDEDDASPTKVRLSDFRPRKEKTNVERLSKLEPDVPAPTQHRSKARDASQGVPAAGSLKACTEQQRQKFREHDVRPSPVHGRWDPIRPPVVKQNGSTFAVSSQHNVNGGLKALQTQSTQQEQKAARKTDTSCGRRQTDTVDAAAKKYVGQILPQHAYDNAEHAPDRSRQHHKLANGFTDGVPYGLGTPKHAETDKAAASLLDNVPPQATHAYNRRDRESAVHLAASQEGLSIPSGSYSVDGCYRSNRREHGSRDDSLGPLAPTELSHNAGKTSVTGSSSGGPFSTTAKTDLEHSMPNALPRGTKRKHPNAFASSPKSVQNHHPELAQLSVMSTEASPSLHIKLVDVTNADAPRTSNSSEFEDATTGVDTTLPGTRPPPVDSNKIASREPTAPLPRNFSGPSRNGLPYSPDEDRLLKQLKEVDLLDFDQMVHYFNGRTKGSLQVRYYSKARHAVQESHLPRKRRRKTDPTDIEASKEATPNGVAVSRSKRIRKSAAAGAGFVSWASLKRKVDEVVSPGSESAGQEEDSRTMEAPSTAPHGHSFSVSLSRSLRQRELGLCGRRAWNTSCRFLTEEVKNHALSERSLSMTYHGTSGDVVALSWAPDARMFAAGSIAISDHRSMQYNMQRNLLVGNTRSGELQELAEHHVPRPTVKESGNVNGLHAMRESQDPRLFLTVTATGFSPKGHRLFTAGTDKMLRFYSVKDGGTRLKCKQAIEHSAPVDLLSVYNGGPRSLTMVATGCHSETGSISVYKSENGRLSLQQSFSPRRHDLQSSVPIFPSSLKWGTAAQHGRFLLAGFSGDEEKERAGEFCLWNTETGQAVLSSPTPNVFDVAWNPSPSSASISFAVASKPSMATDKGMRSVVQCFAPDQDKWRRKLTWECPASDINDVVICPHDDRLIAAGSTDGTVYVWDQRWAHRSQQPLHVFRHGKSQNVLAHDHEIGQVDTGVRFLSWSATSSRLYSGSSDGVVKVWNPYKSPADAFFENIEPPLRQRAAVMSGAFSSDYRDLLIGTENGQINLFSVGGQAVTRTRPFHLRPAKQQSTNSEDPLAAARLLLSTQQIKVRPCGDMPFRQAVQGPNYTGPFLAPTAQEAARAEQEYQQALCTQNEAAMRQATDPEGDEEVSKASDRVRTAQQAINDLQERSDYHHFTRPKAKQFRQRLLRAERRRWKLEAEAEGTHSLEQCDLDCRVLSTSEELDDSRRSELRIPSTLRAATLDAALSGTTELEDNESCVSCFPTLVNLKAGKRCAHCRLKKAGLTSVCSRCSGPAKVNTDASKKTRCERCAFACFRCGKDMEVVGAGVKAVHCSSCNLDWEAGVLGYELIDLHVRRPKLVTGLDDRAGDDVEDEKGLAGSELEHYASLWQDKEEAS